MRKKTVIKIYHGFGHKDNLVLFGHVLRKGTKLSLKYTNNPIKNAFKLLRLFFVQPVAGVPLELEWNGQLIKGHTEDDGFFRIDWKSELDTPAGWHSVKVRVGDSAAHEPAESFGEVFVPHKTQFGFISDIDDTVMRSHSATSGKRLRELLFKNPRTRVIFEDVVEQYRLLAAAHTELHAPNPFFYVSSSEWNLYDYLISVFSINKLPKGAFLLNQIKRWYELLKTGKTKHEGKLIRILRVLDAFPNQRFVFLGDNSQKDPEIYTSLARKFPEKIHAIYIRNVRESRKLSTEKLFTTLGTSSISCLQYVDTKTAINHAKEIGLISG